jgi:hypothetical protein
MTTLNFDNLNRKAIIEASKQDAELMEYLGGMEAIAERETETLQTLVKLWFVGGHVNQNYHTL